MRHFYPVLIVAALGASACGTDPPSQAAAESVSQAASVTSVVVYKSPT